MGKERHLLQRKQGESGRRFLYFRLKIPKDLLSFFGGRLELRRSLKTTCYTDAKALVRAELFRAERLFAQLRGGFMDAGQIRKMVADYFERTLADAEDARADGSGVLPEDSEDGSNEALDGLEIHLSDLIEDLARGKLEGVSGVADSILDCARRDGGARLAIDKGTHDYKVLCREALKGVIAATRVQLERMKGHYPEDDRSKPAATLAIPPLPPPAPVRLSAALAEYVKEHDASGHWKPKTREETEGVYRLLVGIVGDRDMSELDYKVFSGFRDSLTRFPSNHTKRRAYRGKTIPEILAMTAEGSARTAKVSTPLSASSVNKHIIRTGAFLKWAMKRGYVSANFAEGLTVVRKGKESEEREAYSKEDLLNLVRSPLAGFRETKPERFWVPLLGLYTGARLNELCQLHLEDIRVVDGILSIDINSRGEKMLKNVGSRRIVPVHPVLVALGFTEYVEGLRKKGEKRLWPALRMKRGGFGDDFSKWYGRWNRTHITTSKKKVFHSLRANFITALLNAGVDPAIVSALVGHVGGSMTLDRYHKGFSVALLRDAVEKLSFGGGVEEELKKLPL
jgi:integrase